ncbi:hypothetical protein D3C86_2164420 [compost metagenome]
MCDALAAVEGGLQFERRDHAQPSHSPTLKQTRYFRCHVLSDDDVDDLSSDRGLQLHATVLALEAA